MIIPARMRTPIPKRNQGEGGPVSGLPLVFRFRVAILFRHLKQGSWYLGISGEPSFEKWRKKPGAARIQPGSTESMARLRQPHLQACWRVGWPSPLLWGKLPRGFRTKDTLRSQRLSFENPDNLYYSRLWYIMGDYSILWHIKVHSAVLWYTMGC